MEGERIKATEGPEARGLDPADAGRAISLELANSCAQRRRQIAN
jgi:hypothetical protein